MADKFYLSPRWTGEILDCSMPMTFDQFSRCSFDCLYCFSFFQRGVKKYNPNQNEGGTREIYTKETPQAVSIDRISKMFRGEAQTHFSGYIADRYWMQWGGLSDPFDLFERKYGTGLELLKLFSELRYPICFSTKGTWWAEDDRYTGLFERNSDIWNVKVSIINWDPVLSSKIECGCPSPQERIELIRKLTALGVPVTLRLRPFIIGMSDVGGGHLDLIRAAKDAGARAVSTEFFCVERRMTPELSERFGRISEALGIDLIDFYKKNTANATGYMRLNHRIKAPYIDAMEALCRRLRMRFFVSDAHHKDRCATGSCCGLPDDAKWHRGQFTNAIVIARTLGEVSWEDIEGDIMPCFREMRAVETVNFARSSPSQRAKWYDFSMYDLMRYYWNNPNEAKSPYMYFEGALKPDRVNSAGNVVYKFVGYQ